MTTTNQVKKEFQSRAERLGYCIQETYSFEGCFYILDKHTSIVIAGAQEFLSWPDVVRWVVEAEDSPTLQ